MPIVVAALRGKMLKLAVEKADGAFTNYLPLAGLPKVVEQLDGARRASSCCAGSSACRASREEVEPLARFMFASYGTVPVYAAFFRWLGYGDEIAEMCEAWEERDRERAVAAAPWELIEDVFLFGTPEQIKERLGAFVEGGVTLPVLLPIAPPERLGELIEALSSELDSAPAPARARRGPRRRSTSR